MRLIGTIHRWLGGLVGVVLLLLAVSGTLLLYKDAWLRATLPHGSDAVVVDDARLGRVIGRLVATTAERPRSIQFAGRDLGVHRVNMTSAGTGAYLRQDGAEVLRWTSMWQRPELWLFEFHHFLLFSPTGGVLVGWLGIAGFLFVVTGSILWWRTRGKFSPRPWPAKWTRAAILHHHRDLGVVFAPILAISFVTGAAMSLDPVRDLILRTVATRADIEKAAERPEIKGGELGPPDWTAVIATTRRRFPDAELRMLTLPIKPGDLLTVRVRQRGETTPNGRTFLWFDPADGQLLGARDPLTGPPGSGVAATIFPLHAAKLGGTVWKGILTATGIVLMMLGALTTYSFWALRRKPKWRRSPA